MAIRSKDFIETTEGLIFAVVVDDPEKQRHLCFLRYVKDANGFKKVNTTQANRLLASQFPNYLFYSKRRDAWLHGVPIQNVHKHYSPVTRLQELCSSSSDCPIDRKLRKLIALFSQHGLVPDRLGITGSILINAQTDQSDIDLIVYGREHFDFARQILRQLIEQNSLQTLNDSQWQDAYTRRECSLNFEEYVWHEKRKFNKVIIQGTKIDLSLSEVSTENLNRRYTKLEQIELSATVINDDCAFDHPATYHLDHSDIPTVVSFTPTYAGQAQCGELLNACGILEESELGEKRLVVGSSREAFGEYIKVDRSHKTVLDQTSS